MFYTNFVVLQFLLFMNKIVV